MPRSGGTLCILGQIGNELPRDLQLTNVQIASRNGGWDVNVSGKARTSARALSDVVGGFSIHCGRHPCLSNGSRPPTRDQRQDSATLGRRVGRKPWRLRPPRRSPQDSCWKGESHEYHRFPATPSSTLVDPRRPVDPDAFLVPFLIAGAVVWLGIARMRPALRESAALSHHLATVLGAFGGGDRDTRDAAFEDLESRIQRLRETWVRDLSEIERWIAEASQTATLQGLETPSRARPHRIAGCRRTPGDPSHGSPEPAADRRNRRENPASTSSVQRSHCGYAAPPGSRRTERRRRGSRNHRGKDGDPILDPVRLPMTQSQKRILAGTAAASLCAAFAITARLPGWRTRIQRAAAIAPPTASSPYIQDSTPRFSRDPEHLQKLWNQLRTHEGPDPFTVSTPIRRFICIGRSNQPGDHRRLAPTRKIPRGHQRTDLLRRLGSLPYRVTGSERTTPELTGPGGTIRLYLSLSGRSAADAAGSATPARNPHVNAHLTSHPVHAMTFTHPHPVPQRPRVFFCSQRSGPSGRETSRTLAQSPQETQSGIWKTPTDVSETWKALDRELDSTQWPIPHEVNPSHRHRQQSHRRPGQWFPSACTLLLCRRTRSQDGPGAICRANGFERGSRPGRGRRRYTGCP